jgi:CelD/BcsL family acetyltransferase involved in cellulose biosynthesis
MLESGRARLHTATAPDELPRAFAILVDLHQSRRTFLGQPGRFSSPRFTAFHRDVSHRLAKNGRCALHWLEIDGRPAAAEYHFRGGGLNFAYQSGIDPERLEHEPGNLITVALVKQAIERGDRVVDFLRGDEAYKSHFRAEPRPTVRFRIAAPRWQARCRLLGWTAARSVKNWLVAN